jgi:peptidoglycan/LPS O-acetylase OafA/YrhL
LTSTHPCEINTNRFRPEIAGLRAVAVLGVVLCHLKIASFEGGFVGVDIFFVISGYLISQNILLELERNRFSFASFYMRRARRILPALIFTVVATFICGVLWLTPELLRGLAKESTHALLSISNIQYWRESKEYFAATADQLPLLHCWSLSLEEQFYLFWPAFLFFAIKTGRLAVALVLTAAVSFVFSIIELRSDPQEAFFLMPFRIFEFSIGALVIFTERSFRVPKLAAECLTAAGLISIGISTVIFDATLPFPGAAVLVPCFGTAAIILAGKTRISLLLTNPLSQAIGAISYSLYLCHWPMIFFAQYIFGPDVMTWKTDVILFNLMLLTATVMYFFVERPFRQGRLQNASRSQKIPAMQYGILVLLLVGVTHTTYLQQGLPWRLSAEKRELTALQSFGMMPCEEVAPRHCAFGDVGRPAVVELVGDSYVHQYVAALDPVLKRLHARGEASMVGGCPILVGMLPKGSQLAECRAIRESIFARLRQSNASVILGQSWDIYTDTSTVSDFEISYLPLGAERSLAQLQISVEKTIEALAVGSRHILIVGAQVQTNCQIDRFRLQPGPLWHAPQAPCPLMSRQDVTQSGARVNAMLAQVQAKWPSQVSFIKPVDYFCDEHCPIVRKGLWLYVDGGHFSVAGSQYMGQQAEGVFRTFLTK